MRYHGAACPSGGLFGYPAGVAPPRPLTDRTRDLMAVRFRALGEPTRLKILERLFRSPASVGEILAAVGGTQANISKHLATLRAGRLVARRREGNHLVYGISDPALEKICAIVCDAVAREADADARAVVPPRTRRRRAG
jgi:DNA-binding transcriptional ArsR family regulator